MSVTLHCFFLVNSTEYFSQLNEFWTSGENLSYQTKTLLNILVLEYCKASKTV